MLVVGLTFAGKRAGRGGAALHALHVLAPRQPQGSASSVGTGRRSPCTWIPATFLPDEAAPPACGAPALPGPLCSHVCVHQGHAVCRLPFRSVACAHAKPASAGGCVWSRLRAGAARWAGRVRAALRVMRLCPALCSADMCENHNQSCASRLVGKCARVWWGSGAELAAAAAERCRQQGGRGSVRG